MQYSAFVLITILASSMFAFFPNIVIAEPEWKIYKVEKSHPILGSFGVFRIPYKITNGDVKGMMADVFAGFNITIESDPTNDGTLEIVVPREIIFPDSLSVEDNPGVDMDGKYIVHDYVVVNKSRCFITLLIQFPAGSKQILIFGYTIERPHVKIPVHIITDKNNYNAGETIKVSGCTSLSLEDKEVVIEITNPQGNMYKTIAVTPTIDGAFETSLVVKDESAINGTYTAKATYAGKSATSNFVVPEFPVFTLIIFAITISLVLATRLISKLQSSLKI